MNKVVRISILVGSIFLLITSIFVFIMEIKYVNTSKKKNALVVGYYSEYNRYGKGRYLVYVPSLKCDCGKMGNDTVFSDFDYYFRDSTDCIKLIGDSIAININHSYKRVGFKVDSFYSNWGNSIFFFLVSLLGFGLFFGFKRRKKL